MANQYRSVLASSGPAPTGGDALPAEVLSGKTFTNDNGPQTGSMTNNGAVSGTASPSAPYTIPEGYHNGQGVVTASGITEGSINSTSGEPTVITLSSSGVKKLYIVGTQISNSSCYEIINYDVDISTTEYAYASAGTYSNFEALGNELTISGATVTIASHTPELKFDYVAIF